MTTFTFVTTGTLLSFFTLTCNRVIWHYCHFQFSQNLKLNTETGFKQVQVNSASFVTVRLMDVAVSLNGFVIVCQIWAQMWKWSWMYLVWVQCLKQIQHDLSWGDRLRANPPLPTVCLIIETEQPFCCVSFVPAASPAGNPRSPLWLQPEDTLLTSEVFILH